ncbi:hypothetical protein SRIMM317S_01686 [Streptomyces rimosus subsp. rimosus]
MQPFGRLPDSLPAGRRPQASADRSPPTRNMDVVTVKEADEPRPVPAVTPSAQVSVIVIAYNDAALVGEAVRSALAQGDAVAEVIAVDDASTDRTGPVLDDLAREHGRLRVIHRADNSGGCGTPRNDGLRAATGRFVMFLDSDDILPDGAVDALLGAALRHGTPVTAGLCVRRELPGPREVPWQPDLYREAAVHTPLAAHPELVGDTLCVNKLYDRAFLLDHGILFPDGRFTYEELRLHLPGAGRRAEPRGRPRTGLHLARTALRRQAVDLAGPPRRGQLGGPYRGAPHQRAHPRRRRAQAARARGAHQVPRPRPADVRPRAAHPERGLPAGVVAADPLVPGGLRGERTARRHRARPLAGAGAAGERGAGGPGPADPARRPPRPSAAAVRTRRRAARVVARAARGRAGRPGHAARRRAAGDHRRRAGPRHPLRAAAARARPVRTREGRRADRHRGGAAPPGGRPAGPRTHRHAHARPLGRSGRPRRPSTSAPCSDAAARTPRRPSRGT